MSLSQKEFDKAKYKLIALDLDGTMLHMGELHPNVEHVLDRLSARGLEIVIVTGRSLTMVPSPVLSLPFLRYAVTSSGARVTSLRDKSVLGRHDIETDTALAAIAAMRAAGAAVNISCDAVNIISLKNFLAVRRRMPALPKAVASDYMRDTKITLFPSAALKRLGRPVEKLNFYFKSVDKCAEAALILKSSFPLEAVSTMGYDLEVSAQGVNKAVGLTLLCRHLGLQMSEVVAIGDSANDIEMLRAARYSVAMGNAGDDIKRLADHIAPPVTENGVATVLTELFG